MEEMDLVNDNQPDELCVSSFTALAGDNIPLLRSSDNDLGLSDFYNDGGLINKNAIFQKRLRKAERASTLGCKY